MNARNFEGRSRSPVEDHFAKMDRNDKAVLAQALREIKRVLGPKAGQCSENGCEGCRAEIFEAYRLADEALT